MAEWYDNPCSWGLTDDGQYYQAVGTKANPERIEAIEIIKALDRIAEAEREGRSEIKGIQISYGKIDGDLNILDAGNLDMVMGKYTKYIQIPNVTLDFRNTIFEGAVSFTGAQFGGLTFFCDVQFLGKVNFDDAQFSEETQFSFAWFRREANFNEACFKEHVFFMGTYFENDVVFVGAQFEKHVNFGAARFGRKADFTYAQFKLPAEFRTCYYWSDFLRVTHFASYLCKDKLLFSVKSKFQSDLDNGYFSKDLRRKFKNKNISLSDNVTIWIKKRGSKWLIDDTQTYYGEERTYRVRKEGGKLNIYGDGILGKIFRKTRILPKNSPAGEPQESAQFYLDSKNIDEVATPKFKRYVADQNFLREFKIEHPFLSPLWRWSSDYGRSFWLWFFWAGVIAILFGLAYAHKEQIIFGVMGGKLLSGLLGVVSLGRAAVFAIRKKWIGLTISVLVAVFFGLLCAHLIPVPEEWQPKLIVSRSEPTGSGYLEGENTIHRQPTWFTYIYFSVVTFTTLGFGDVTPLNTAGEILLTLEVILGYIMLGGLISIFANKLARRS